MLISEQYRKKFSEELRKALSQNDEQSNKVFELEQNRRLHEISYELVQGKLSMLFDSINAISNAKELEDKFQFEINELTATISLNKKEKTDLDWQKLQLTQERDKYRQDLNEIVEAKTKMERERHNFAQAVKDREQKLKEDIKFLQAENDKKIDE